MLKKYGAPLNSWVCGPGAWSHVRTAPLSRVASAWVSPVGELALATSWECHEARVFFFEDGPFLFFCCFFEDGASFS